MNVYKTSNTKLNLCDYCDSDFATCRPKEISFGDSVGHDNVIRCDSFDGIIPDDKTDEIMIVKK